MQWFFYLFGVFVIIGLVLVFTGWWRYVLTGYLIVRVSPYEQPGGGAGRILVVGDSTGYGTGASRSKDSVAGRLGGDYSWYTIINNSGNGRTIAGAQRVIERLTIDDQYSLILLQIGANDLLAGRSPQVAVEDMRQLITRVRQHTPQVVILSAGNIGATPRYKGDEAVKLELVSREYDGLMRKLASEYQNVSYVSLFDEPVDDPFVAAPQVYTAIDGLHPTSAGYGVWYQKAKPYFDQALAK